MNHPQFKELETWDGREALSLEVWAGETRPLYCVKFRPEKNEPCNGWDDAPLSAKAQGVDFFNPQGDKIYRHWRGHDTGSLHTRSGEAVLTWTVEPRDEIIHVFQIQFRGRRTLQWEAHFSEGETYCQPVRWESAFCDPVLHGVCVECGTDPGRGPMLSEDGLEDAYGGDALHDQIAFALNEDFRKCLCCLSYEEQPEGDYDTVVKPWNDAKHIKINARKEIEA